MPRPTLITPPRLTDDREEDLRTLTEYLQAVYQHIQVDLKVNETLDAFEERIAANEISLAGVESHFNDDLGGIAQLDQNISPTYVEAEVQEISDKVDEIIAAFPTTTSS